MKVLIKDIADTKRKLAKAIRNYELNKINTEKFRSLVYGLSKYAEIIKTNDFEQRINEIEKQIDEKNR